MLISLTGRVFFNRFPALGKFLLTTLREAVSSLDRNDSSSSSLTLFPVLTLLARLLPSTLAGASRDIESALMREFADEILRLVSYKYLKLPQETIQVILFYGYVINWKYILFAFKIYDAYFVLENVIIVR